MTRILFALLLALGLVACDAGTRPTTRLPPGGDAGTGTGPGTDAGPGGGPGDCTPSQESTPETCSDGIDNNCNGRYDCSDVACSGVGACPICGQVDTPLGAPLALPDGVGGTMCSSDADCPGAQRCFSIDGGLFGPTQECRESYESTLSFIGFGGATFDSINDITSLCVTMEHSWIRDLEITLEAPNGARVRLNEFLGQEGGQIYLGGANDCDDADAPVPGMGQRYCWTPTASRQAMLDYANGGGAMDSVMSCNGTDADMMPPGDYGASDPWENFIGAPLNGDWTLSITDLWGIDNGYIFEWSISFDPTTVEDCGSPLI